MEASRLLKRLRPLLFIPIILCLASCASICRIDGPYEGRVVDAETGKPIEGVVVHGTWSRVHATVAGASTEYYDSYEMLTDKNGEFKIPGKGLLLFSNIEEITLSIFKAGYEQFPKHSPWSGLKKYGPFNKVLWNGNKGTFRLKKKTIEERRNDTPTLPFAPSNKKLRLLIKESNKEMMEIGFPESTFLPEE